MIAGRLHLSGHLGFAPLPGVALAPPSGFPLASGRGAPARRGQSPGPKCRSMRANYEKVTSSEIVALCNGRGAALGAVRGRR